MEQGVDKIVTDIDGLTRALADNAALPTTVKELITKAEKKKQEVSARTDLDETDKAIALGLWDSAFHGANTASDQMKTLHTRLEALGQRARQKKAGLVAIVEAGEHDAVVKSLNAWLADLTTAVQQMHEVLDSKTPGA